MWLPEEDKNVTLVKVFRTHNIQESHGNYVSLSFKSAVGFNNIFSKIRSKAHSRIRKRTRMCNADGLSKAWSAH